MIKEREEKDKTYSYSHKSKMFITPIIYRHNTPFVHRYDTEGYRNKEADISIIELRASATVEASLVIPIFIYAVMAVMYFIQIIAVRVHVNDALYTTLKKCAAYAYIYENYGEYAGNKALESGLADNNTLDSNSGAIKKGMVVETIRRMFLKELGEGYARQNNIVNGDAGLIFISTKVLQGDSVIDIKVSYYVKNPFDIFGESKVKIADRKRINAWLGEDKDDYAKTQEASSEYVYITAGGEVYHTNPQCTHLLRFIKECQRTDIDQLRNSEGAKYYSCQRCDFDIEDEDKVYYTEYGTRFHSSSLCTELRRDIQKVKKSCVSDRRLCEKCGEIVGKD